jgi:hypothetical protein
MWFLLAFVVVALIGCAIAIGDNSAATVMNKTEAKREVNPDTPVIEELIIDKVSPPKIPQGPQ